MEKLNQVFVCIVGLIAISTIGCPTPVQSVSGAKMMKVGDINSDSEGHTVEQNNIAEKIRIEANPDKVWYLHVISPYSGKTVLSSTIQGKITSSNKRLTPRELSDERSAMRFTIGGLTKYTNEIPSEDGTFGSSAEYIYWKDKKGSNHRHYLTGGQIIHVTDSIDWSQAEAN